ncbi:UNVERIFIED_CONTAM: hypothetical protein FKN15_076843 [Acipenser sinensis]
MVSDEGAARDATQSSSQIIRESLLSGRRSALLNVTVGSLEAFGGEVSRGDLETSDLVYCVADLQFNNQKLHNEMRKLKLAVEVMEEANNKLLEEKEDFRAQAKSGQQSDVKVKVLQEELEEMKVNLNSVEENRVRMVAQNKQMNIRNTMDIDGLQKKIADLCNINANLQLLRNEKNKLENHINMMQPDLASGGMSLSLAYRLNQSIAGSLHTELALAQQSPEVCGMTGIRCEVSSVGVQGEEDLSITSMSEVKAEFQRLSLGFKCDAFTLDKRLRLEERSRDLAEGNLKKELNNCNMLLEAIPVVCSTCQTLIPLCAGDNQSLEIVQRLQKNLDILNQSMTRVSTRAELVGAIHQVIRLVVDKEVIMLMYFGIKIMFQDVVGSEAKSSSCITTVH